MITPEQRDQIDRIWDRLPHAELAHQFVALEAVSSVLLAFRYDKKIYRRFLTALKNDDQAELEAASSDLETALAGRFTPDVNDLELLGGSKELHTVVTALEPILKTSDTAPAEVFDRLCDLIGKDPQFTHHRTPPHLVSMLIRMLDPQAGEYLVDPACGTGSFLLSAAEYAADKGGSLHVDGCELAPAVARIARINLLIHGVEDFTLSTADGMLHQPDIRPDVIVFNPPFAATTTESVARQVGVGSKRSELVFAAWMIRTLKNQGRAAMVVPLGLLSAKQKDARNIRQMLLCDNYLEAVVEMPPYSLAPTTSIRIAVVIWRKEPHNNRPTTMIRLENDGYTADYRRKETGVSDVEEAIRAFHGEKSPLSTQVTLETIEESDFNLTPSRYVTAETEASSDDTAPTTAALFADLEQMVASISDRIATMKELTND